MVDNSEREHPHLKEKADYIPGMNYMLNLSQERKEPYKTTVLGKEFVVLPGVFSPAYYAETAFYTPLVVDLLKPGENYLDLGCGAGVTTVFAALKGVKVMALDINPIAVDNTKQNAKLHHITDRVDTRLSDVYSALQEGETFDVIYWNTPFGYRREGTSLSELEKAVFDPGYEANHKFVVRAKQFLKPGGQLLLGFSSTLGDLEAIKSFAKEVGIEFKQIGEMKDPNTPPEVEILFQLLQAKI